MEAFLADTLINAVLAEKTALGRLIDEDALLSGATFSLVEIEATPNLVTAKVRSRLRSELWHNLKNANKLYWTSFIDPALSNLNHAAYQTGSCPKYFRTPPGCPYPLPTCRASALPTSILLL